MTKHYGGNAECNRDDPGKDQNCRGHPHGTLVLGPNWIYDHYITVNTHEDQEEDAAEHVKEHCERGEHAHEQPKDPVHCHSVDDVEGETGTVYEVGDGQAEVPGGVDCLLHLETSDPDDHPIPTNRQQEDNYIDHQEGGA